MAVRKSERRRLRRELISRTARVWSRLNKSLIKELTDISQTWLDKLIKPVNVATGDLADTPKFPERFTRTLKRTLREAFAYGYWLQYLYLYELSGKKYYGKITLAEGDDVKDDIEAFVYKGEWNSVIPQDSVDWINNYMPKLAGVFEQNVLEATRKVIQNSLVEGLTLQERMKALREAAPELSAMSKHRIEAIARTEITRADTLGRLTSMKANDDVIGVEFSAIMDDRTTDICASRHGLVMRLDDPRLAENTPPLHVNCRSLLIPLTVYDYPDGLLTSHEFESIVAGIQRPEDIAEVEKILKVPEETQQVISITEKVKLLQEQNDKYQQQYDDLEQQLQNAVKAKDMDTYNNVFQQQNELLKQMRDLDKELKSAKVDAADQGFIYASGISPKLDSSDVDAIMNLVSNAPVNVRKVWNLYEDEMKIATAYNPTSTAHYSPSMRSISFSISKDKSNDPPYNVMFHELGHLIDNAAKHFHSDISRDSAYGLYDTLKSEVDEHVKLSLAKLKAEAIAMGKNPKDVKKLDAYYAVQKEICKLPHTHSAGVSDLFSGITFNKVKDGWTHKTKYWKDDPEVVCCEFFAETFSSSIVNSEAIELVKQYVPKSYAIFEKILDDIVRKI